MDNHPSPRFIAKKRKKEREEPASEYEALQFFGLYVRGCVGVWAFVCVSMYVCVIMCVSVCVCGRVRARAHVFVFEINMYYMCGWYH